MSYNKKILNLLIALTKEIRLIKPNDVEGYYETFLPGARRSFMPPVGIQITWWYTKKAFKLCDTIALISIQKNKQLEGGSKRQLSEVMRESFRLICLDCSFFNSDKVWLRPPKNLFEARSINDVEVFSKHLWSYILQKMEDSIGKWCVVYPLPHIITESFEIIEDNISVINKSDEMKWAKLESEYPETRSWDPSTGLFMQLKDSPFSRLKYETLLICRCAGNSVSASMIAKVRFKRFLSAVLAFLRTRKNIKLTKFNVDSYVIFIQFQGKDNKSSGETIMPTVERLLPNYSMNLELTEDIKDSLQEWYKELFCADLQKRDRIKKASHFINNAMNSNGIDSYIHYFISLDALFGKRGDVERLITEGVHSCLSDTQWTNKVKWLYDLRSELVHGGSRFEEEWDKFERYVRHFDSHPFDDVMDLSFQCIINSLIKS